MTGGTNATNIQGQTQTVRAHLPACWLANMHWCTCWTEWTENKYYPFSIQILIQISQIAVLDHRSHLGAICLNWLLSKYSRQATAEIDTHDTYAQAMDSLNSTLMMLGSTMDAVVKTTIFMTNISVSLSRQSHTVKNHLRIELLKNLEEGIELCCSTINYLAKC